MRRQPRRISYLDNDDPTPRQVARVFGGAFHVLHIQNPRTTQRVQSRTVSVRSGPKVQG